MSQERTALKRLPVPQIVPEGWLKRQLQIQMDGLSGRLHDIWDSVGRNSGWLGGTGENWERGPYYLDGLVPMAFYLQDEERWTWCTRFIEWTLHSQREDGNFGPAASSQDYWSRYVMLKVLIQYEEITADTRVVPFMERYFAYLKEEMWKRKPESWSKARIPDLLYSLKWLYERTGKLWLLELGKRLDGCSLDWPALFAAFPFVRPAAYYYSWEKISQMSDAEQWMQYHPTHVVNVAMGCKHPAMRCFFDEDRAAGENYRKAASDMLAELQKYHGVPTGAFNGDEHLSGTSPSQGTELCSVVELMFSMYALTEVLGTGEYADLAERLAYNALPATVTEDFMAHQYLQQVNQICVSVAKRNWFNNGEDANLFGLEPHFGCCTANMHQGWPKFVNGLWYREGDDTLVSMLLAPSSVSCGLADGALKLRLDTQYPFREELLYHFQEAPAGEMALKIRIPRWCTEPKIETAGHRTEWEAGFVKIRGRFERGDVIRLRLPMEIRFTHWHKNSLAVERGPLLYGLDVKEEWSVVQMRGNIPDYQIRTDSKWNYALDGRDEGIWEALPAGEIPFSKAYPPGRIRIKGRRLETWKTELESAAEPPESPVDVSGEEEVLTLLPYGCTKLRIAEFPYYESL